MGYVDDSKVVMDGVMWVIIFLEECVTVRTFFLTTVILLYMPIFLWPCDYNWSTMV